MDSDLPEPEPPRPWHPEEGPEPRVRTWPPGDRPALAVWAHGAWHYAPVTARQDFADGSIRPHHLLAPIEEPRVLLGVLGRTRAVVCRRLHSRRRRLVPLLPSADKIRRTNYGQGNLL
ncbi:hypothetical protein GCM10010358_80640 [Streptomyces minutiscleroticus]|uniref:Uncharacterized protein n=1 Tax=Streptomyces minutiscleroticus TaxID=68238 RepID=A0A918UAG1_9ACTN|nr:hypothetical protein GCM10010358_80640 [Streptomyces minutiscleroticus]